MSCREITALLSPSLDDALSDADVEHLRAHIATCPPCAARLERLRATRDAFRMAAPGRRARPRNTHSSAPIPPRAAVVVGAALAAALVALVISRPGPASAPPHDEELQLMEFGSPEPASPPCYYAADCGMASAVPPELSLLPRH